MFCLPKCVSHSARFKGNLLRSNNKTTHSEICHWILGPNLCSKFKFYNYKNKVIISGKWEQESNVDKVDFVIL